jgi:hypothetical protein
MMVESEHSKTKVLKDFWGDWLAIILDLVIILILIFTILIGHHSTVVVIPPNGATTVTTTQTIFITNK